MCLLSFDWPCSVIGTDRCRRLLLSCGSTEHSDDAPGKIAHPHLRQLKSHEARIFLHLLALMRERRWRDDGGAGLGVAGSRGLGRKLKLFVCSSLKLQPRAFEQLGEGLIKRAINTSCRGLDTCPGSAAKPLTEPSTGSSVHTQQMQAIKSKSE
ncbi:hypothetical protein SKAU_G00373400 [Synaphobranchus kaupii]|uniref:Uncharacterized protein n=1 Tax=Synaphobranchus kaupii TaxID=118154 RepID=A0A9Q1EGK0_SYNKA|nr:hypothetical protein SKAU_G00373400 [Synaphobranchus kaupii]